MRRGNVVIHSQARTNGHSTQTVGIDELTGLWNRAGFVAAATPLFVSCQRREAPIALAYFDFQATGTMPSGPSTAVDQVLMAMAEQMRSSFRGSDIIGRIDALRFAVLLTDCTDEALAAVEGVRVIAGESSSSNGLTLTVGRVRSAPGTTLDELMRDADLRTREIKRG